MAVQSSLRLARRVLIVFACWFAGTAAAATYHVRTDGGDAAQCTGLADAP